MKKAYFTAEENFEQMIHKALQGKEIFSLDLIDTGWTNIVYEAHTNEGDFFFRFPRNDFWVAAIKKDAKFTSFIHGKTKFNTVKLELLYDQGRTFSIHKKFPGETLANKMEHLSSEEIKIVAHEMADFMVQLHQIKVRKNDDWIQISDFLNGLVTTFYSEEDKAFWKKDSFFNETQKCFVHGDLNSSNVIIDEKNHVTAIIDFGFAGVGDKYSDIARILSRVCPENYKNEMIEQYEKLSNEAIDRQVLNDKIDTWKKIDQGYINYMKRSDPSVRV